MAYYKLIRDMPEGTAVRGRLYRTSHYYNKRTGEMVERLHYLCETMENEAYMIPALIYKVQVTRSPKFRKLLPILLQVPSRSGIRIHKGTKPEHSKGCILIPSTTICEQLTNTLLNEQQHNEPIYIELCDKPSPLSNPIPTSANA